MRAKLVGTIEINSTGTFEVPIVLPDWGTQEYISIQVVDPTASSNFYVSVQGGVNPQSFMAEIAPAVVCTSGQVLHTGLKRLPHMTVVIEPDFMTEPYEAQIWMVS